MRYIKLLFASVILVSMSACVTDNQSDLDMMGYVKTINIVGPEEIAFEQISGSAQTKATSVSNSGALVFNWAVGDTLGIFPNKGNQVEFPITAQEGSTSASFDGGGWALRNNASYAAYYPFSVWNYFRNNQAVVLDYSGQVQEGNGSFAHLSAYDYLASAKTTPENGSVTFQMDRQGSILYIDIVVPEPATITSLTISCDEAIFVKKAALDISGNNPVVTPIETKESLTLAFENTTTTEQNETVRAYMAVQPVDFSSKTVTATLVTDAGTYTAPVVSRVVNKGKAAFLRFSDSFTDGSTESTTPPNNEIWYTSTDGNIVEPYKPESINVGIISNTYEGGKGRIVFDGAVTSIGNNAFSAFNAKNLKSIVFPATLTSIGNGAFSYNSNLENIQLNEGLLTIGSSAFECDRALDSIYIPSSVTFVNGSAFMECTNLQKFLGDYATMEGRLLVINGSACGVAQKDLTQIELPQGITEISTALFQWCYNLTSVTLPSTLQKIGVHAFYDCYSLKSISPLPESLQEIGGGAFAGCSKLEGFTGKFATQDGRFLIVENHLAAFAPNGLKAADIPDGVETIDRQSMSDFSSLETVRIPSSVTSIALYAFSGCNNLNSITVDASSVPSGDYGMFNQTNDCPIYVPFSSVDAYKSALYWSSYAERIQAIPDNTMPEAVDLGLPSGLKWATCNVGATAPEEYGDYFAWGETEPYYTEGHSQDNPCSNWKTNKTGYNWASYKWCNGTSTTFTKYNTDSSRGSVDNKTILDPEDDAAHVNWGGTWRMPTDAEWSELKGECTWTWTTQNGVNGRLVTGPNGNTIFLPAAGFRYYTYLTNTGSHTDFWSSFLFMDYPYFALSLYINSDDVGLGGNNRYHGFSVRPVSDEGVRLSVTGITLNKSSLTLTVDETATITATVSPANATQKNVIWSSNNTSVATVDYKGKVTAVAAGTATVTAKTYDGGYTATCSVTVMSHGGGNEGTSEEAWN